MAHQEGSLLEIKPPCFRCIETVAVTGPLRLLWVLMQPIVLTVKFYQQQSQLVTEMYNTVCRFIGLFALCLQICGISYEGYHHQIKEYTCEREKL